MTAHAHSGSTTVRGLLARAQVGLSLSSCGYQEWLQLLLSSLFSRERRGTPPPAREPPLNTQVEQELPRAAWRVGGVQDALLGVEQDPKSFPPWLVLTPAGLKQRAAPAGQAGIASSHPPARPISVQPPPPLPMLPLLPARSFPGFKSFVSPRNVSSHCL